jgi:hypothetical protein
MAEESSQIHHEVDGTREVAAVNVGLFRPTAAMVGQLLALQAADHGLGDHPVQQLSRK